MSIGYKNGEPSSPAPLGEVEGRSTILWGRHELLKELLRVECEELMEEALKDYFMPVYPLLKDEARDKWIVDRLRKIRERYLEIA